MNNQLRIELLGGCTVRHNNQIITDFKSRKAEALLAYLAYQQRPFSRIELAQIFWSESDPQQAAANLRKTLSELRHHVGDFLVINRDDVSINSMANYWLDTAEFTRLINQGQQTTTVTEQQAALETAIALYHGDFLAGFYLRDSLAFDEWASLERERLLLAATEVLRELVSHALHHGHYTTGIRHAAHWLALDPLHEAAHRQMMRLQARQGQRNAALAQYEQCREILAAEMGVHPTAKTQRTAARIRIAGERVFAGQRHNESPMAHASHLTRFIGREEELARLNQQLDTAGKRLITITGMGGVGKTRLVLQLAAIQHSEFLDGVWFVPLAGVTPSHFVVTINTYLGIPVDSHFTPYQQMCNYLHTKELLLILDNCEHLLEMGSIIQNVLQTASNIKIVITSRTLFNLNEEWVLKLSGLPFPGAASSQPLTAYAAVQLFQERAFQVRPTFAITPVNEAEIRHICQLVAGLPLGLELAAAAIRAFTPAQIAAQIQQSMDFLDTGARGLPPRHRRMRAVFDYAWQHLTGLEQTAMVHLSIFRGSFSAAGAAVVAQTDQSTLVSLTQKSLLSIAENGRFHMHELIRQYAYTQLKEDTPQMAMQEAHAGYYATFLTDQLSLLRGERQREVIENIQQDFENIQAAWDWGIMQQQVTLIDQMLRPLYWFYSINGRYHDGLSQCQQAAAMLADLPHKAAKLTWARSRLYQAVFAHGLARYDESKQWLDEAEAIATSYEQATEQALIQRQRGRLAQARSQYANAIAFYEESLALFQAVADPFRIGTVLLEMGNTYYYLHQLDQAEAYLKQALHLQTTCNDYAGRAKTLNSLAAVAQDKGDYAAAETQYHQSLNLRRQLGDKLGIANLLNNLGNLACNLENWDDGLRYYQESLALKREFGAPLSIAITLSNLGTIYQEKQDFATAESLYQESLKISQRIDDQLGVAFSLANLADLARLQQQYTISLMRWQQVLALAYTLNTSDRVFHSLLGIARVWSEMSPNHTQQTIIGDILSGLAAEPTCPVVTQAEAKQMLSDLQPEIQQWQTTHSLPDIIAAMLAAASLDTAQNLFLG